MSQGCECILLHKRVRSIAFAPELLPGRVGKTSVAYRFVHNTFNHNQQATLQASFLSKEVQVQGQWVSPSDPDLGLQSLE